MSKMELSYEPFIRVVALDEAGARQFVTEWMGLPADRIERVEDGGPNHRPEKFKPEAREWHVYMSPDSGRIPTTIPAHPSVKASRVRESVKRVTAGLKRQHGWK